MTGIYLGDPPGTIGSGGATTVGGYCLPCGTQWFGSHQCPSSALDPNPHGWACTSSGHWFEWSADIWRLYCRKCGEVRAT